MKKLLVFLSLFIFLFLVHAPPAFTEQGSEPGVFLPLILKAPNLETSPSVGTVTTNLNSYPDQKIPRYDKLELNFKVKTVAKNLQWPYDPDPPVGVEPKLGITVDALFTPDSWQTVFVQPAFYYQEFLDETKDGKEWFYPTGNSSWKVRFAPNETGLWHYKIVVQDVGGAYESDTFTFEVASSTNKGFVKVSTRDPRYFEYDDETYFPALGYNLSYRRVDWINPTLANQENFQKMSENGIQLIRAWLSQWSIYGSAWSPWRSHNRAHQTQELDVRLRHDAAPPFNLVSGVDAPIATDKGEVFLWLSHDETVHADGKQWNFTPCVVVGWESPQLPVKPDTDYRVKVRYKAQDLMGPKMAEHPYGFTVKLGGWLWHDSDEMQRCYTPGTGKVVAATYSTTSDWSHYRDPENPGWKILEGRFNSGSIDFLEKFYLAIENASSGDVFVDYVWLEEDLGHEQYGPNVVYKPWMAYHRYFDQRNSYALDKVLELAKQYNVYLKLVIHEKQDYVLNIFEPTGKLSSYLPSQNPQKLFFGNGRETDGKTKTRWLQETWWRYLQARWGYSANIHSWELLNEGNPNSTSHHILADELGKYFQKTFIPEEQQTKHPNMHLVTTSFWSSFPNSFWSSSDYSFVDYADVHHYAHQSTTQPLDYIYDGSDFYDAALFSQKLSTYHGAKQTNGPGKPVMRGETGFIFKNTDLFAQNVTNGTWLHNFTWAGINPGGVIESYWIGSPTASHIYETNAHDHRPIFRTFFNFIQDIPLSNGYYEDAAATSSEPDLRVWGQKDLKHECAHLWVQNRLNTWKNIYEDTAIPEVSGTISIMGFQPSKQYLIAWWDTYQSNKSQQVIRTETVTAQSNGLISLSINRLSKDIAVRISDGDGCSI